MSRTENDSADPAIVVTQYETLRRAALGDVLPPEARSGLMLFLRRGMWGWVRAVATTKVLPEASRYPAPNWSTPEDHRAVVHIFAAMAIKANHQGATP